MWRTSARLRSSATLDYAQAGSCLYRRGRALGTQIPFVLAMDIAAADAAERHHRAHHDVDRTASNPRQLSAAFRTPVRKQLTQLFLRSVLCREASHGRGSRCWRLPAPTGLSLGLARRGLRLAGALVMNAQLFKSFEKPIR